MVLNVKQKYPGAQGGAEQLYASDTRLSLRRREQVFTRLSKSYKFVIKLFVFRHQGDQQLYIHLALHLLCLLISSRQCRSHRRLDFFYNNRNNLVQLEDTAIKTERCCSMQCTERTTVLIFTCILNQTLCLGLSLITRFRRGINFMNITW